MKHTLLTTWAKHKRQTYIWQFVVCYLHFWGAPSMAGCSFWSRVYRAVYCLLKKVRPNVSPIHQIWGKKMWNTILANHKWCTWWVAWVAKAVELQPQRSVKVEGQLATLRPGISSSPASRSGAPAQSKKIKEERKKISSTFFNKEKNNFENLKISICPPQLGPNHVTQLCRKM